MPYKKSSWVNAKFYVVDVQGQAVVGLSTSKLLKLLTVHVDTIKGKPESHNQ
jgi:hypothetical protein